MTLIHRLLRRRREIRDAVFDKRQELPWQKWAWPTQTWLQKRLEERRAGK